MIKVATNWKIDVRLFRKTFRKIYRLANNQIDLTVK